MPNFEELSKAFSQPIVKESSKATAKKTKESVEVAQHEKDREQDRGERKRYAESTFWLVVFYISAVLLIVVNCGKGNLWLSDTILVALIVTSFAKIVGLFMFVMKYLFPNNGKEDKNKKEESQ